jgi:hypothetical protein
LVPQIGRDLVKVAVVAVVAWKPLTFSEHACSLPRRHTCRVAVCETWRAIRSTVLVLRSIIHAIAVPVDAAVPVIRDAISIRINSPVRANAVCARVTIIGDTVAVSVPGAVYAGSGTGLSTGA